MKLPPLGLYIHLPWCERKCPYCDFNSHERNEIPERNYVDALLRDFECDLSRTAGREFSSIFIGGGTPSLFSPESIKSLLDGVRSQVALSKDIEVTMEANPGSAEAKKFARFRAAGINRLSLGIQSFDDDCLAALGRVHDSTEAIAAINFAHEAGFDNINLDLMHGLPGQSVASAVRDLRTAIEYRPAHLSWYQLTIEPNTVFYRRAPLLPVEEELGDIQDCGEELLKQAGYVQYEVSAFAHAGKRSRHNLNYWNFGDYLGIGAGAHSKVSLRDGRIQRCAKHRQPEDYLAAAADEHTVDVRWLDDADRVGEFAMNALRLKQGFSIDLFSARTGLDGNALDKCTESLCERGLLQREADTVRATAVGYRFLDTVVAEFFQG